MNIFFRFGINLKSVFADDKLVADFEFRGFGCPDFQLMCAGMGIGKPDSDNLIRLCEQNPNLFIFVGRRLSQLAKQAVHRFFDWIRHCQFPCPFLVFFRW